MTSPTNDPDRELIVKTAHWDATCGPNYGSQWYHYKNNTLYEVVTCAVDEATLKPVVVYRENASGRVWTRPLANWSEVVTMDDGRKVFRFRRV